MSKPKKPMHSISERMRSWRESKGLSQTAAAEAAGVSPRNWQNWEQGHRRNPRLDSIAPVLAVLDKDGF
jgi:transcriptional regulator with XRE-family HTH domain